MKMRRTLRTALSITTAGVALTACSDQPTSAPAVVPQMTRANAAVTNLPATACNFSTLKAAVRDYVAAGNDVIYDYIRGMGTAPYAQGMNGLARLAEVRGSTAAKKSGATAAQGAEAAIQFLACMPVGDAVQDDFRNILKAAMDTGGMFEVPATSSTAAIFSRGEAGSARFWAARPKPLPDDNNPATSELVTWGALTSASTPVRFLVFGYKTATGFDYNVVPMLGQASMPANFLAPGLVVGACITNPASNLRVNHDGEVLFDESMGFCAGQSSPPIASLTSGVGTNFAALVRKTLSVFAPQTAFAAFGGGVGGAVSELSPADIDPVTPTITYVPQPPATPAVGQAMGIKVKLSTNGTLLYNADVTLTITGNSGLYALFFDPGGAGTADDRVCFQVTRKTGAANSAQPGIADFSTVALTKAGGYSITANATFDKLPANATLSNPVNVKNSKFTTTAPRCS